MPLVLIVDDDESIRGVIQATLRKAGYEVREASDADEGIRKYREKPADVVVADMIMPRKPGWEMILELKSEYPDLKAIGISAGGKQGPFGYLRLAKRFGAKRILQKPIKRHELLTSIKEVLIGTKGPVDRCKQTIPRAGERKSILVVDKDRQHTWNLCEGLTAAGHTVTDTCDSDCAYEIIKKRSFEVAILDVTNTRSGDTDLIKLLRSDWSHPLIVGMADFNALAVKKSLITRGANYFVSKPVDLLELLDLISPPPGFSSQFEGFDILEYLQFILLSGKRTVVEARSPSGEECKLFCSNGSVVHAQSDGDAGLEAFFRCVSYKGGSLRNVPWEEPKTNSIQMPGDFLLMEAARRREDKEL